MKPWKHLTLPQGLVQSKPSPLIPFEIFFFPINPVSRGSHWSHSASWDKSFNSPETSSLSHIQRHCRHHCSEYLPGLGELWVPACLTFICYLQPSSKYLGWFSTISTRLLAWACQGLLNLISTSKKEPKHSQGCLDARLWILKSKEMLECTNPSTRGRGDPWSSTSPCVKMCLERPKGKA